MIKVLFTVWALLIAIGSYAQESAFSWVARAVDSGRTVVQKLRTRQGLCILTVSVAGKNYDFLLDTGAPTVISKDIADRLLLEEKGTVRVVDALGNAAQTSVVTVPALSVSGMEISGIPALVYESSNPVFSSLQVQGILGSNALQQLVVSVSARQGAVRLQSFSPPSEAGNTTAMTLEKDAQGSPFLSLSLENRTEEFLFDSGFEGLLDLSDKAASMAVGNAAVAVRILQGDDTYTGINGGNHFRPKTVSVGALHFPNATLHHVRATITGDSRSKIGASLFTLGDVTLDYRARHFSFKPYLPK